MTGRGRTGGCTTSPSRPTPGRTCCGLRTSASTRHVFIETGPHKHAIQQTFFLYVYEPGGNRIELCNPCARLIFAPDWEPVTWTEAERAKGQAWGLATIAVVPYPRNAAGGLGGPHPRSADIFVSIDCSQPGTAGRPQPGGGSGQCRRTPGLPSPRRSARLSSPGEYAPRQRLVEIDLCERFGTSRFILRSALQELAAQGLVEFQRNRGARVRDVSLAEAIEITEVRILLEGLLAARAAERVTKADARDAAHAAQGNARGGARSQSC